MMVIKQVHSTLIHYSIGHMRYNTGQMRYSIGHMTLDEAEAILFMLRSTETLQKDSLY